MKLLPRSEELVLLAILHLKDNAYGVTIRRYLSRVTGHDLSIASVYVPLDRLKARGFVADRDQPDAEGRGGRRRRYFKVTAQGMAALEEVERMQKVLWAGYYQIALG